MPADGLSGLSDEDNLGFTYNVLDRYIREGICENKSVKEKIDTLHKLNLHKLQLMPAYQIIRN
jgi:NAD+ synthase